MRKILACAVTVAVLHFGLFAVANEKPPADFQQAMKDIGAAMQKIGKDVEAKDYEAIATGAATLKKNFMGPVGKYWTEKKDDDGLKQCTEAFNASDGLEKAAKARDDMAIANARKAVGGTCASCHKAHRVQLPDKTYEIK